MTTRPRGRPPTGLARQRLYVYLSAPELARVARAAGNEELSAWARAVLLAAAPSIGDDPEAMSAALDRAED